MPNASRSSDRPTIRAVAKRAGVSRQTVSNVLNCPGRVSPELQVQVQAAIDELGYRPSAMARSLAVGETRLVAFRVGDGRRNEASLLDPFMRELARIGAEHGYRLVLDYASADDGSQIASYGEMHARRAVDAVVLSETHLDDARPAWLAEHAMPFVAFGRPWGDESAAHAWVDVDMELGLRLAVAHLVERGHRAIGFVGGPVDQARKDSRHAGWASEMAAKLPGADLSGLSIRAEYSDIGPLVADLMRRARPTALACGDDACADEAMHVLGRMGLEVGRDVAITGADDSQIARRARPALTSVVQPISDVAALVWQSLISQFAADGAPVIQKIVPPTLAIRASSDWQYSA